MIVTVRCGEMISSCLPQIDGIQTHISIGGVLIYNYNLYRRSNELLG